MKLKIVFSLCLLMSVAFGNLPSCYTPAYDNVRGWYEYADGLNHTLDYNGTYDVFNQSLNATQLSRLGATGMTKVHALHFQDDSNNRGLAYLFENGSFYYAVFQWNNQVYGIPFLSKFVNGSHTEYKNAYESVFFSDNGSLSAYKISMVYATDGGTPNMYAYHRGLKFGNSSLFSVYHEIGLQGAVNLSAADTFSMAQQGNVSKNIGLVTEDDYASFDLMRLSNTSEASRGFRREYTKNWKYIPNADGGAAGDYSPFVMLRDFKRDYFSCGDMQGRVCISAYEGAEGCDMQSNISQVNCSLNGEALIVPASNSSVVARNTTDPRLVRTDADFLPDGSRVYYPLHSDTIDYELEDSEKSLVLVYRNEEHSSRITFVPYEDTLPSVMAGVISGFFGGEGSPLEDIKRMFYLTYKSPTDNIDSIELDAITINTSLEVLGTKCECGLFGCQNWTLSFFTGYNSTHFKLADVACTNGSLSAVTDYLVSESVFENGLNTEQESVLNRGKVKNVNFGEPLYKTDEGINRFFMFWLEFGDSSAVYEGDIVIGDNENFILDYNVTDYEPSHACSQKFDYGSYEYYCDLPDGLIDVNGVATGVVTVDDPFESIILNVQSNRTLWLEVKLTSEGLPVSGKTLSCNNGGFDVTDGDGWGNMSFVNPLSSVSCFTNFEGESREAVFPIGDFYNSQRYGVGATCADFNGAYKYELPIDYSEATIRVNVVRSGSVIPVEDALILYDGSPVGGTGEDGSIEFKAPFNYSDHEISVEREGFYSDSQVFSFSRLLDGVQIEITPFVNNTFDEDYEKQKPIETPEALLSAISNREFISFFVVLAAGGVGAYSAGVAGLALGLSGSSIIMTVFFGFNPIITSILVFLSIMLGAAFNASRLTGKGNGG